MENPPEIQRGHSVFKWSESHLLPLWVFLALFVFTLVVYRSTLFDIPRSDHLEIFAIFQNLRFPADFYKIAFVEFFGDPRFQILAWTLHFFEIKLFGFNFLPYHLVMIGLHAINGMLVFMLVYSFSQKKLFAFLTALAFVSAFTHLEMIAWPIHLYHILAITLGLSALVSVIKFHRGSGTAFLYLAYALTFVQLFLWENNSMAPAFIFLFSVALGWSAFKKRSLILKNLALMVAVYLGYAVLYLTLMPTYAGIPKGILSGGNILKALAGVPIEFFNTAFGHNVFANAPVVFDELVFHAHFTTRDFSMTTGEPFLIKLNFLVYLALFALAVAARKPARKYILWLSLLAIWGLSFSFLTLAGRAVSEAITQSRYVYFPTLVLVVVLAHLFEPYFARGWSLAKEHGSSFLGKYGGRIVLVAFVILIGLNTAKLSWNLTKYMEYRAYPNKIYYAAKEWLSKSENRDNKLFISVTTYPLSWNHEKLAWGADIVPDLFLNDPRITKDFQEASHILEWRERSIIRTNGTETLPLVHADYRLDNDRGSAAEVRMKILKAHTSGFGGAMLSLKDGKREGKLSFFPDRIEIRDGNELRATHPMSTRDDFHTYRITVLKDSMVVRVDGEEVASVPLSIPVSGKEVLFGDFSGVDGENISAQIEYLIYSAGEAATPEVVMEIPTKKYGQGLASIRELRQPPEGQHSGTDFAITFGILAHGTVSEDYLEVFGPSPTAEPGGQQWWLRLDFVGGPLTPSYAGQASVVLGYSQGRFGRYTEGWVFRSQPVPIRSDAMTHIVLVREKGTFGLIVNGRLVEKVPDFAGVDFRDIELPLGKFYQMLYRKPYYYAHTFVEFGRSSFSLQDKGAGYVFENIRFNPRGFQDYHMTLGW